MSQFFDQFGLVALGAVFSLVIGIAYGIPKAQKMAREVWSGTAKDLETRIAYLEKRNEDLEKRPDLTQHAQALAAHGIALSEVATNGARLALALENHESVAQNRAIAAERRNEHRNEQLISTIQEGDHELIEELRRIFARDPNTRSRTSDRRDSASSETPS